MRHRRKAASATVIAILLSACSAVKQPPAPPDRIIATTSGEAVLRSRELNQQGPVAVPAPPEKMLAALSAAYADLGIDVKVWDPPRGEVGNKNFTKMYRMGGQPLSDYLGCGVTTTGEAANNYRLTLSLVSQVVPEARGSAVLTTLTGFAEDLASSKGTISCSTRGTLEAKLLQIALTHLPTS
jgi:hypothetical protein